MFLGVLNTVFLNISNYLPHLGLRNRSIQTVVIMNFVVISNVGIKRSDCNKIQSIAGILKYIKKTNIWLSQVEPGKMLQNFQGLGSVWFFVGDNIIYSFKVLRYIYKRGKSIKKVWPPCWLRSTPKMKEFAWGTSPVYRKSDPKVVTLFKDKKIILLPASIHFALCTLPCNPHRGLSAWQFSHIPSAKSSFRSHSNSAQWDLKWT